MFRRVAATLSASVALSAAGLLAAAPLAAADPLVVDDDNEIGNEIGSDIGIALSDDDCGADIDIPILSDVFGDSDEDLPDGTCAVVDGDADLADLDGVDGGLDLDLDLNG